MTVAEPKADVPGITRPMTYEEYISGPEEMARYDIIDGWKVYRLCGDKQLPNPTREYQQIQGNLYRTRPGDHVPMRCADHLAALAQSSA